MSGLILLIAFAVCVGVCAIVFAIPIKSQPNHSQADTSQPPKPRIVPPTDSDIYTFTTDSQLKPDEWMMLLNGGWLLLTCTTEQYKDYAGCYPDAPCYHRTRWHYVFHRVGRK